MHVTKTWFALISASRTTVSKPKHDFYRHWYSGIFVTETGLNFENGQTTEIGVNNS